MNSEPAGRINIEVVIKILGKFEESVISKVLMQALQALPGGVA
ncbi:MAG: hypothetical protein ACI97A_001029 [Planctomycetota bacterium]|jgi:hypothetical protein